MEVLDKTDKKKIVWEDGAVCERAAQIHSFATEWMTFVREFMGEDLRGGQQGEQAGVAPEVVRGQSQDS